MQPVRKKSGWVWMREWMEKKGKERDERGRKTQMDMEDITGGLRELRKRAEKVEDNEKRRRYEGCEEKRPVKPVAGLILKRHQENVRAWSKVVLNAPGPPRGVVVLVESLLSTRFTPIYSDPDFLKFYGKCGPGWIRVDQEDQGDHNPPWWTSSGFYILLMKDRKDKGVEEKFESEARAFFGGSDSAFGGKVEPPIASGSTFPAGVGEKFKNDVWQMEFGYRP